jgi:uncharacterized protein Yka (UPF0111/DUF47 family)
MEGVHVRRWFLPRNPDLLALLNEQVAITVGGLDTFAKWSAGDASAARVVRDAEHEADAARRKLLEQLRAAFSTPLEPEDIYELSERLDALLNGAKNAVRESEVMNMAPDFAMESMGATIAEGGRHLATAFAALVTDNDQATEQADAAIKCQRAIERAYRKAMSDLQTVGDVTEVTGRRELYRRYARLGETLVSVAERIWYAVVKTG